MNVMLGLLAFSLLFVAGGLCLGGPSKDTIYCWLRSNRGFNTNPSDRQFFRGFFNKGLTWILTLLLPAGLAVAGPAYPLKTIAGKHYVVDQKGTPFFIQGDSPWYLTEAL